MANEFWDILVTDEPLTPPHPVFSAEAGAVVEFWGVVRGLENGEEIAGLDYEAHVEMATHQLEKLVAEAREQFGFQWLVLHHRIGFVAAAEPSLFVRVVSERRGPALKACEWVIERMKEVVPIWKKPMPAEWRVSGP
ncbi:MAG: molybdenum cofactor biosynthesis protein MoaE [Chthoniobacteraceae bacterium]